MFVCEYFQLTATVNNSLASFTVTWTITVFNVNDPPEFSQSLYEISIDEFMQPESVAILTMTVTDPDSSTPDTNFHLSDVTTVCK